MPTIEELNRIGAGCLPGRLGLVFTQVDKASVKAHVAVEKKLMAPNGFLHAGAVVTLADTCCGYGCATNFPEGATGFTTIELKSNHLGTAREGTIECVAAPVHIGRTTQAGVEREGDEPGDGEDTCVVSMYAVVDLRKGRRLSSRK